MATYGELLRAAQHSMAAALGTGVTFGGPRGALLVAQARTRLYQAAAHALEVTTPRGVIAQAPALGPEEPLDPRWGSARLLHAELVDSVQATNPMLDLDASSLPGTHTPFTDAFLRSVDAARTGWDIALPRLVTRTDSASNRDTAQVRSQARALVADAALIVRGVAELDPDLAIALLSAARDPAAQRSVQRRWAAWVEPGTAASQGDVPIDQPQHPEPHLSHLLARVAADCSRTPARGLIPSAAGALTALNDGHRAGVDTVRSGIRMPRIDNTSDPEAVGETLATYTEWLHQEARHLTVADLANVTAVSSRIAGLTGLAHAPTSLCPVPEALDTVRAWRSCYHALQPLASIHPAPNGSEQARRIATWADNAIMTGPWAADPARWQSATAAMAERLPGLAKAAGMGLICQYRRGALYTPALRSVLHRRRAGQRITADPYPAVAKTVNALRAAERASLTGLLPAIGRPRTRNPRRESHPARLAASDVATTDADTPSTSLPARAERPRAQVQQSRPGHQQRR
jgi:hypothetical protein